MPGAVLGPGTQPTFISAWGLGRGVGGRTTSILQMRELRIRVREARSHGKYLAHPDLSDSRNSSFLLSII